MTYSKSTKYCVEKTVRDIRRATRRNYSAQEKIRIVLEGLRGEESIAELCPMEGINQNLYYRWSKEFLEAGKTLSRRYRTRSKEVPPQICTAV
jgi:transposase